MAFNFAKRISIVGTTVALATLVPGIAFSQPSTPNTPNTRPATPANPSNRPPSIEEALKLTPQQVQQIRDILVKRQEQIEAVLTPAQRSSFTQAVQAGQNPGLVLRSFNLETEKIARIRSIVQSSNENIKNVLTPEQLQLLQNQVQPNRPSGQR